MCSFPREQIHRAGPRLAQRRWRTPLRDERWRGRLRVSGTELQQRWAEFLGRLPWEWFVTLTFDPKRVFPVGRTVASREAFWWCGLASHVLRKQLGWAYAVERGYGGAWHAHVLVLAVGNSPLTGPTAAWKQRNGLVDARRVTDCRGAALYTAKDIVDDEVVLSDSLIKFTQLRGERITVPLGQNPVDFGMNSGAGGE